MDGINHERDQSLSPADKVKHFSSAHWKVSKNDITKSPSVIYNTFTEDVDDHRK